MEHCPDDLHESPEEPETSRRQFLGGAAGLTGAALLAVAADAPSPRVAEAAAPRSFVSGNFALELGGKFAGFLKSVDGGAITAEVISEPLGSSYYAKKHLGNIKYEDFAFQVGFGMSKDFFDLISLTLDGQHPRFDGAVVALDFKLNATSARDFKSALITEVTIPAMDGSSKDAAYMTVKIDPESIQGRKASGTPAGPTTKSKTFLPSNFRLQIDGLDCKKVNKIEAFTIKQAAVVDSVGDARDYEKEPAKLEFPNLVITLAESSAQSWFDWHEDFVITGNNDEGHERSGSLSLLAPNLKDELARISFFNLGIFSIGPDTTETETGPIGRVTAELYCERMTFEVF